MASGTKVTEIAQLAELTGVNDVYVKKGTGFYRIPLAAFFAELIDARRDSQGELYESVGDFLRHLETMTPDVDLSKLDLAVVDDRLYLYDTEAEETIGDGVVLPSGGGGSDYGSTMRITRTTPATVSILDTAGTCVMEYSWSSIDTEDESATGAGSETWKVGNTVVARRTVQQGNNSFDIFKHLAVGVTNTVKLTIEDSYGNSKTVAWTVNVSSFGVTWNLEDMEIHGSDSLPIRLVPTGSGTKTLKISVDGTTVFTQEITTSGRTVSYTVSAQAHGAHTILAWIEATVDGETITTPPLRHVGIWTASGNDNPIVAVYDPAPTVAQYSVHSIRYMIYDPSAETADATIKQGSTVLASVTVDRAEQVYAYRAMSSGTVALSITCGEVAATISMTVTASQYDIQPVTNGLVMDVDPAGHTNAESSRTSFGYKDGNGTNHPFTFSSNFDWTNGGFQQDASGVTAFVVRRGTYVQFDRSFFNDDAAVSGKAIKMIFKATNVGSDDAEILTCKANGIGLKMTPVSAVYSSELQSRTVRYCKDEQIEMDLNIDSSSEDKFAVVWFKGVPARAFAYSGSDNWVQTSPELVKIGSDNADVWIYRLKMYSNSLTRQEILDNYIADCTDASEMVARYERNDIFAGDGSISITKLAAAAPSLRILHIWAEKMTVSKDDDVTCKVEMIFTQGGEEFTFVAEGVTMKAQGTSSLEYILAALNLDLDFKNASSWVDGSGEAITGYAMTEGAIPVNYLNFKANVASSENANNVLLADDYNTYQPAISKMRDDNPAVRDTIQGVPACVFFTNTTNAAITVGARTVAAGDTILYAAGDLNNSKKNYAVFGQTSDYPGVLCVEVGNNNNPQCRFKSADLSGETWDGKSGSNFEFRYPKSPTAADKAAWQTLLSWVVSTDADAATGDALPSSVTYDGVTYTTDSASYRRAKFKAELADHFNVDSLLYHYVFTERHLMVDNRAKNTFFSYEPSPAGVWRWNINKNYDDDTAQGTDNSGGLTFTYGMEDTDSVGASKVFNAADSVLWVNLRDLFSAEIDAMFRSREAAGAWNVDRILAKYKAHQSARPEALMAEDMFGKYFSAYKSSGEERFMAQMLGTKEYQNIEFERNQGPYCSSKHRGSVATADRISMRLNAPETWAGVEPSGDIVDVVPYQDIYLRVQYGNAGEVVIRAKAGQSYDIEMPAGASLNDLETYIYSASKITSIGSLAAVYTKFADISSASRLKQLILGSSEEGYENTGITAETGGVSIGASSLLEKIDLRGTPNLAKPLDLSGQAYLKEVYLTNSGITGVTFAPGAPVETAYLGSPATLVARNLQELSTFSMSGVNLTTLWVENSPAIDTKVLCGEAESLARGRLIGVNWNLPNTALLFQLAALAGLDDQGGNTEHFVLTGTAHVTAISSAEYDSLHESFPNLTITYDELLPSYTVTFKNYDGTVLDTQTVTAYGAAVNPITAGRISTPVKPATVDTTYTFAAWDKAFSYVTDDLVVTATFTDSVREYTVRWWSGTTLMQEKSIEVYTAAKYTGELPTKANNIFFGWDQDSSSVTSNMDINAVYQAITVPDSVPASFTYLYSDVLAEGETNGYSFGQFVGACHSGHPQDFMSVGDKILIDTSDTTTFADSKIILKVIGFNHFKKSDGSGDFAAVVFHMVGVMNANRSVNGSNTNAGGWPSTAIKTWLNGTMYNALPDHWKSAMTEVEVLSSKGGTSDEIVSCDCKVFLLSQAEVGFETGAVPYKNEVAAGAERLNFSPYNSNNNRIKKTYNGTGSAVYWWLRSPSAANSTNFCNVATSGAANSNSASYSFGFAWGFCIG
ncbi:MAG: hypothetical protein IKQ54_05375 [Oscillospiraceae bacterium]|nr:hypothetical protein [Oscillospiraceae bacterium]